MTALPSHEALAPSLLSAFAVELRRSLGLVFPPTRAESFEGGIVRAAAALGEVPASLLLRLAEGDRAAIEALALELTIGETYFFRHPHHFDLLRVTLRKIALARAAGDPIRLWSAGCSSGEEAYSMAIAALEVFGPAAQSFVEILGTDLNAGCLARAGAATYGDWSFRNVSTEVRERWFERDGALLRVAAEPRSMVRFVSRNLLDGPPVALAPHAWSRGIDVIFCRNVLIYFDPAATQRVTAALALALAPGGVMVPGPSDPLLRSPYLGVSTAGGLITYQRPIEEPTALAAPLAPRLAKAPAPLLAALPRAAAPSSVAAADMSSQIDRARRLADGGDSASARAILDVVLASDPLQQEAYALRAVLAQADGDHLSAAVDADRAILLQSSFAYAHLIAASSRAQIGERTAARRHLRNAQRLLSALAMDARVPGSGGVTARELLGSCQQLGRSLGAPRVARAEGERR
jgi:chemotaxis protein methyltransferase CheR